MIKKKNYKPENNREERCMTRKNLIQTKLCNRSDSVHEGQDHENTEKKTCDKRVINTNKYSKYEREEAGQKTCMVKKNSSQKLIRTIREKSAYVQASE